MFCVLMYIDESSTCASVDLDLMVTMRTALELVVVLCVRLHSFYGILSNTVRRLGNCTFTNILLVTLGGSCHIGGALAVAPIWRVAPVTMMLKKVIRWQALIPWCLRCSGAVPWAADC